MFLHTDLDVFDAGQNCTLVGPGHGSLVRLLTQSCPRISVNFLIIPSFDFFSKVLTYPYR